MSGPAVHCGLTLVLRREIEKGRDVESDIHLEMVPMLGGDEARLCKGPVFPKGAPQETGAVSIEDQEDE